MVDDPNNPEQSEVTRAGDRAPNSQQESVSQVDPKSQETSPISHENGNGNDQPENRQENQVDDFTDFDLSQIQEFNDTFQPPPDFTNSATLSPQEIALRTCTRRPQHVLPGIYFRQCETSDLDEDCIFCRTQRETLYRLRLRGQSEQRIKIEQAWEFEYEFIGQWAANVRLPEGCLNRMLIWAELRDRMGVHRSNVDMADLDPLAFEELPAFQTLWH